MRNCQSYITFFKVIFLLLYSAGFTTEAVYAKNLQNFMEPDIVQKEMKLDLVQYFPVAEVYQTLEKISFLDPAERQYLPLGWSQYEKENTGKGYSWINSRVALVDVPRIITEDLKVRLAMEPPKSGKMRGKGKWTAARYDMPTDQSIRVFWNGNPIGIFPVMPNGEPIEFLVPKKFQVHGLNRMELFPRFWIRPNEKTAPRQNTRQFVHSDFLYIRRYGLEL